MRIAAFAHEGAERTGVVLGEEVYPLPRGVQVLEVAAAEPAVRERLAQAARESATPIPLSTVRLLPPVRPASIRDFVCFERHVEGATRAVEGKAGVPASWYEAPTFLFMNPHSAIGSGEPVEIPYGAELMDFELEVAAVIGRDGRNHTPEQAGAHIAGYAIMNDWSARDLQAREMRMGLGPAKGKDFGTTLGPWLVTTDELEAYRRDDRLDLELSVSVNGERIGGDRLSSMAWSFEELVAYASRSAWVRAGDVIASGTCANGSLAELWGRAGRREPPPLKPGDVVTMTVEGIGEIVNSLVAGPSEASPIRRARTPTTQRGG